MRYNTNAKKNHGSRDWRITSRRATRIPRSLSCSLSSGKRNKSSLSDSLDFAISDADNRPCAREIRIWSPPKISSLSSIQKSQAPATCWPTKTCCPMEWRSSSGRAERRDRTSASVSSSRLVDSGRSSGARFTDGGFDSTAGCC